MCPFQIPALEDKVPSVASPRAVPTMPFHAELYRVLGSPWARLLGSLDAPSLNAPSSFQGHPAPAGFQPHWLLANPTPPGPENRGPTAR